MDYLKLVFFMLFSFICQLAFSSSLHHLCPKDQALALLQFNHMFTINASASVFCVSSYPKTLSWNKSTDCCSWDGVYCDETTGQVIELNLTCSRLQGKFPTNSSLFQLSNLKKLDLSGNDFSGSFISPKFGELSSLMHLDLSDSRFTGVIPAEISHLSKLNVLRIESYGLQFEPRNFELLLKNLTQLRELELDVVNISSTFPLNFSSYLTTLSLFDTQLYGILPERVFHLSNLESLDLSYNPQLTVRLPTTKWNSSASLMDLDLSRVNATGRISESFGHLTSLRSLGIHSCNLSGSIPKPLWNLTNIEALNLADNHLEGPISVFFRFGKLSLISLRNNNFDGQIECLSFNRSWTQLVWLDFSSNHLNGTIPSWIFSLPSLTNLYLSSNSLTGPIPSNVSGLQNLQSLDLSSNHMNGTIPSWIFSLPSLTDLDLSSNSLTGQIPSNVSGLQNLQSLRLSSNHLNGTIPSWIFSLPSLWQLNLSANHFSGNIQEFKSQTLSEVDLKHNQLQGPIPKLLLNQSELDFLLLSHNNLSGQIASTICNLRTLRVLDLGSNHLEGTIPLCLGEMSQLLILDLGSNHLEGIIPLCLGEMSQLWILDLSNNSLSGTINTTFSIENQLQIIKFDGNKLEEKVPPSLINCKYLKVLDLGNNELSDRFPKWLGTLPDLQILKLRSNKFYGPVKDSSADNLFVQIRVIDLSSNGFSGDLPVSLFKNFEAMKINGENNGTRKYVADGYSYYYTNSLIVTTKGLDLELPRVLTTQIIINLSRNRFEGHIPSIIGDLIGLRTLNLSHNVLEGHIPASLHNLSVLESLDLSSNKISGEIPPQLASGLTSLEVLNLSHNHFVGCIPKGKQFDTFDNNSYQGNDELRGFPLSKDCGGGDGVQQTATPTEQEEEEEDDYSPTISWEAVLMGYSCGLVIGLSVIYIMLSTQYPAWFSRMFEELQHRITRRMQKRKKRH